jgi:hypothetical protein
VEEQVDVFLHVFLAAFERICAEQNAALAAAGMLHCGSLCVENLVRSLEGPDVQVEVSVISESWEESQVVIGGTNGFYPAQNEEHGRGHSGDHDERDRSDAGQNTDFESDITDSEDSWSQSPVRFSVNLTMNVQLAPDETVTCVNPLMSPVAAQFAEMVLTAPWVLERFTRACSVSS